MRWFSHLRKFGNMCLLNRVYSTFCGTQIRQCLLQIFISFCSFNLNTCCLGFTVTGNNSNLFSSLFGFSIFNLKLFDKLVYFLLCLLQFDLFFLQINFKLFNTLSCFTKFIKTKLDVLIFNIDTVILLLVYILVEINK